MRSSRGDAHGAVGRGLRLVPDVAGLAHDPPPAGELQQDAVRVLEVNAGNVVGVVADGPFPAWTPVNGLVMFR